MVALAYRGFPGGYLPRMYLIAQFMSQATNANAFAKLKLLQLGRLARGSLPMASFSLPLLLELFVCVCVCHVLGGKPGNEKNIRDLLQPPA